MARPMTATLPALSRLAMLAVIGMLMVAPVAAVVNTGTDDEALLPYWEVVEPGISIRIVQRLPDQTRGFFQARGFSETDAELIANNCVFQTVFKNTATASRPTVVEYDLLEWVVVVSGEKQMLKSREYWKKIWIERRVPSAAQLAFEWGLLPTRQVYGPGDYNWGMSIYGLSPGTKFDLELVWRLNGERRSRRLEGVECAPDVHPEPIAQ